jgi:hypothetical protein
MEEGHHHLRRSRNVDLAVEVAKREDIRCSWKEVVHCIHHMVGHRMRVVEAETWRLLAMIHNRDGL